MGRQHGGRASARVRGLLSLVAGAIFAAFSATGALADDLGPPDAQSSVGPKQPVTAYNGSYTYSIPIEVPGFRGIEPRLSLSYDSARGVRNNAGAGSWLGIGWKLAGVSAVERVSGSPDWVNFTGGRGSPSYGAAGMNADTFTLDGDELMPCNALSSPVSPSCNVAVAGGTVAYTGRVENYLRIRKNNVSDKWNVTAKDGTIYRYATLADGTSDFRWYLESVTDLHGNHVDYSYDCSTTGAECVISTIKYFNQGDSTNPVTTISFIAEARPPSEQLSIATGGGILKNMKHIAAVAVALPSGMVRAYALKYDAGDATGLSRLISVQEYGRDAVVDASGNVTGTALPATALSYSGSAVASTYTEIDSNVQTGAGVGDYNGDGRDDMFTISGCTWTMKLSNGTAFSGPGYNICDGAQAYPTYWTSADFTGDNADDILLLDYRTRDIGGQNPVTYYYPRLSILSLNGSTIQLSLANDSDGGSPQLHAFDGGFAVFGDFNGDGKTDFISQNENLWLMGANSFSQATGWTIPDLGPQHGLVATDINGDGKTDLYYSHKATVGGVDKWQRIAYISTGTNFVAQTPVTMFDYSELGSVRTLTGDVNGDGRSDAIVIRPNGSSSYKVSVYYSNGQTILPADQEQTLTGFSDTHTGKARLADVNGDGRIDLLLPYDGSEPYGYYAFTSLGGPVAGTNPQASTWVRVENGAAGWQLHHIGASGDFNGDGRTDFAFTDSDNLLLSGDDAPDLLTSVTEPLGGNITIVYEASSGKAGTKLPFIMQVVQSITYDDGRNTQNSVAATSYTYQDGDWDIQNRMFKGFATVTAQLPPIGTETNGPEVISKYHQKPACYGQASVIDNYGDDGTHYRNTVYNVSQNSGLPFFCRNTSVVTKELPDTTSPKTTKTSRSFDLYGNVTVSTSWGDLAVTSDDSNERSYFNPNTTDYVVGCPYRERTFAGTGTSGLLKDTLRYYGEATVANTPAMNCDETQTDKWIAGSTWATTLTELDDYSYCVINSGISERV